MPDSGSQRHSGWHSTLDTRLSGDAQAGAAMPSSSLVRRLTWLGLTVLGLSLLLSMLAIVLITRDTLTDQQQRGAEQAAALLAENLAPTLAFQDVQAAEQLLQSFNKRPDLLELQVWNNSGRAFAQWRARQAVALPMHPPTALKAQYGIVTLAGRTPSPAMRVFAALVHEAVAQTGAGSGPAP